MESCHPASCTALAWGLCDANEAMRLPKYKYSMYCSCWTLHSVDKSESESNLSISSVNGRIPKVIEHVHGKDQRSTLDIIQSIIIIYTKLWYKALSLQRSGVLHFMVTVLRILDRIMKSRSLHSRVTSCYQKVYYVIVLSSSNGLWNGTCQCIFTLFKYHNFDAINIAADVKQGYWLFHDSGIEKSL